MLYIRKIQAQILPLGGCDDDDEAALLDDAALFFGGPFIGAAPAAAAVAAAPAPDALVPDERGTAPATGRLLALVGVVELLPLEEDALCCAEPRELAPAATAVGSDDRLPVLGPDAAAKLLLLLLELGAAMETGRWGAGGMGRTGRPSEEFLGLFEPKQLQQKQTQK